MCKDPESDNRIPSMHHYEFAHRALPSVCAQDPVAFFETMHDAENRKTFLDSLWATICKRLEVCRDPGFGIEDIIILERSVAGRDAIVVVMPPPEGPTEAYFVGIVPAAADSMDQDSESFEYFVLERADTRFNSSGTVLCKWSGSTHMNLGSGCSVDVEAFVQAMKDNLKPGDTRFNW